MISKYLSPKNIIASALLLSTIAPSLLVAQTKFNNPKKTIKEEFWGKLYKNGGETFYCKKKFSHKTMVIKNSYILPTQAIRDALNCGSKRQCERESDDYNYIVSDLHNMVPANTRLALKMKRAIFEDQGDVEVEQCGLKRSYDRYEPDNSIKGDIARKMAYMKETYKLDINMSVDQIKRWSKIDPVSAKEIKIDAAIKEIQGNSNPYVTSPEKIDLLK